MCGETDSTTTATNARAVFYRKTGKGGEEKNEKKFIRDKITKAATVAPCIITRSIVLEIRPTLLLLRLLMFTDRSQSKVFGGISLAVARVGMDVI